MYGEKAEGEGSENWKFFKLIYKSLIRVLTVSGGGRSYCK